MNGIAGDVLMLVGFICLAAGATFAYRPLGLIVIGIELVFVAYVLEVRGLKK